MAEETYAPEMRRAAQSQSRLLAPSPRKSAPEIVIARGLGPLRSRPLATNEPMGRDALVAKGNR